MLLRSTLAALALAAAVPASAVTLQVTITNNAPTGGVALTPVWVGFHSGSFDSYNGGLTSQVGLERLAEDGDTSVVSQQFLDFDASNGGYTYVDNSGATPADALVRTGDLRDQYRVDGTLGSPSGPPPLQPGESTTQEFTIRTDGSNRYFSYLSMVLPTNDFFVANGNPFAHDLSSLYDGEGTVSFNIGLANGGVNDAGTEQEDFDFAAPPTGPLQALFSEVGFGPDAGQTAPNQSTRDDVATIANVVGDPFADFLNADGLDLSQLNFNDASLYTSGIATITITAVPEPSAALIGLVGVALAGVRTRRRVA